MTRYAFVNNEILKIFRQVDHIEFPLDVLSIISTVVRNCKYMTYQEVSNVTGVSIEEVSALCESHSGCTHYDVTNDRYLIMYNDSSANNNNEGRQRWTLGHELGHIICNHLLMSACCKMSENTTAMSVQTDCEAEADYFAATLLAPFPLFKELGVSSADDVQRIFGLSRAAAINRWERYVRWRKSHLKRAWENDMVREYQMKK